MESEAASRADLGGAVPAGVSGRILAAIRSVRWMDGVIVVMGVMMVNQFFSHLDRGRFGEKGVGLAVLDRFRLPARRGLRP